MNEKLREYIDNVFNDVPQTLAATEIKEEFYQNLIDKYNDLIGEGKSETAAYNIAVASIGDVSQLVAELKGTHDQYAVISERNRQMSRNRSIVTAIAVALYILCPVPIIVFEIKPGITLFFLMIAAATGMLIFNNVNKVRAGNQHDTVVNEFNEWRDLNQQNVNIYKSVSSAVWSLGLVVYFLVSFLTGAWHLTWLIFLIIGAVNGIIKALFDLQKQVKK